MGPLEDILFTIRQMPENSAEDVRVKYEAFDAFMDLLDLKFQLLLPRGRPKTDDDVGFAIGKMPKKRAAEIRAKEEVRATAKELMNRHLGELRPAGGVAPRINASEIGSHRERVGDGASATRSFILTASPLCSICLW
jgi:chromatin segregation and condensation protein Rec8/ScpA/Scc1 (kleisin family)